MREDAHGSALAVARLPLAGTANVRDIGGLAVAGGGRVRRGRLIRGDALDLLDDAGRARLAELGLRTVVDLREPGERERRPNALGALAVREVALPLYAVEHDRRGAVAAGPASPAAPVPAGLASPAAPVPADPGSAAPGPAGPGPAAPGPAGPGAPAPAPAPDGRSFGELLGGRSPFGELYLHVMALRGDRVAAAVAALAQPGALPALVHCTGGKDRTGIVVALALSAVGVADDDVVADYAHSGPLLASIPAEELAARLRAAGPAGDRLLAPSVAVTTDPAWIADVLSWARDRHGDAAGFLLDHGLTRRELSTLRAALVDDAAPSEDAESSKDAAPDAETASTEEDPR